MSAPSLEFWFEFASTYSHIAAQRIEAAARNAGVPVVWRPFLLGPIFQQQGWNDSPFNIYPAKGVYMWKDMERTCAKLGVPFRRPSKFPRPSLLATRIALALEPSPALVAEFVRRVYLANFHDDADTTSNDVIRGILQSMALPDSDAVLERATATETKDRLRARSEEAVARGIFGAPTFLIGSELYWGNDRLEDALAYCAALRSS
jgi:2-hydroxychromene-2-carboxylate isomerase